MKEMLLITKSIFPQKRHLTVSMRKKYHLVHEWLSILLSLKSLCGHKEWMDSL